MYFVYDDQQSDTELELVLECLERKKADIFLKEIYPQIRGVRIYDLNKWALRLYKIVEQYGIPVEVVGEKWEVLFPDCTKQRLNEAESYIMKIWADGNPKFENLTEKTYVKSWFFARHRYRKSYMDNRKE